MKMTSRCSSPCHSDPTRPVPELWLVRGGIVDDQPLGRCGNGVPLRLREARGQEATVRANHIQRGRCVGLGDADPSGSISFDHEERNSVRLVQRIGIRIDRAPCRCGIWKVDAQIIVAERGRADGKQTTRGEMGGRVELMGVGAVLQRRLSDTEATRCANDSGDVERRGGKVHADADPSIGAVDAQCASPRSAVRGDLHGEVVVAGETHFSPPRPARLEEERRRIAGRRLVDLDLVSRPGMSEKGGRRGNREPVDGVGGGIHAEQWHALRIEGWYPCRPVEDDQLAGRRVPGNPARCRREEDPGSILKRRDFPSMAGKNAHGRRADPIARAIGGCFRRRVVSVTRKADLHQGIQHAQCLVMGDMLLRLRGQDIGQIQRCCAFHVETFLSLSYERINYSIHAGKIYA